MDLNTYMGYRVAEQEIAQAAARAERARLAAERPDQVVPRVGIVGRTLAAFAARRVPTTAAGPRTVGPRTACDHAGSASDRTPRPA